jgi:hypothetical protein
MLNSAAEWFCCNTARQRQGHLHPLARCPIYTPNSKQSNPRQL